MSIVQYTEQEQRLTNTLRMTTEALKQVTAERDALKADVEVLLGHIDTVQRCSNSPAIYNLATVVLNRFAAMKGKS